MDLDAIVVLSPNLGTLQLASDTLNQARNGGGECPVLRKAAEEADSLGAT